MGAMSLQTDDDIENKKIAEFSRSVSWTRFWNGQKYSDSRKCDGIWGNNQPPEGTQDGACVSVGENGLWKITSCKELLPFVCKKPACINGTSDCGNGKCINTKWFCDGINDCSNNLDEMNCANRCSFYKTGASGTITQGSYKPNADCFWTVEGPVGTQLKLTFTTVRTEKDRDIIEVWGGSKSLKTSTKLTTLSGDSDNRDVYSFNNFLIVRFRSDATVESSGFVATWRSDVAELSRTVQDIAASDNWQSLSSPFYPSTPPYGFSRHWLITTDADSILTLEIFEVDLMSDWELLIYDGDSYMEQPVTIRMSSGLRSPPIYISSSNKIRVVLKGIKIISGNGINMRVKKGCDVQIQKNAGEIYSPGYLKNKYPTSIDCSWMLKAPDADKRPILLNLVEFSLAADEKDVVKVYNGQDTSSPAIHEGDGFKGDLTNAMKSVAGGDTVHLTFTSSLIQADGRFKIEFSIGKPVI
ncbi:cubilin-like [Gigantopelta aegis]|uniref:cubilin-like n=1 Tax=Gigantopelta aegis TaxID=1735272 RepID=UPI001B88E2A5|nr:cubilin-like [Gigantopelta aegis]